MRPCKGYNSELIGTVRFTSLSPQRETPSHQQPPPPAQAAPRPHAVATDLPVLDARVRGIAWRVAFCAGLFHAARRFRAHPCCDACSASFFPWPNTGPVTGFPAAAYPLTIGRWASAAASGRVPVSPWTCFHLSGSGVYFVIRRPDVCPPRSRQPARPRGTVSAPTPGAWRSQFIHVLAAARFLLFDSIRPSGGAARCGVDVHLPSD